MKNLGTWMRYCRWNIFLQLISYKLGCPPFPVVGANKGKIPGGDYDYDW